MEILNNLEEIEQKLNHFKNEKNKLQKEKANHSNKEKATFAESVFVINIFFLFIGVLSSSLLLELQNYFNGFYLSGIVIFIASFLLFYSVYNCLNTLMIDYINTKNNYLDTLKKDYFSIIVSLGFSLPCLIGFLLQSFYSVVDVSQISFAIYSSLGICFLLHVGSFILKSVFSIGNTNYINPDKYEKIKKQESLIIEEEKKYIKKTKQKLLESCSNFGRFELLEEQINKNKAPLLSSLFITSREEYAKESGFNDFASLRINELEKIATMEIIETS
jgi:hypothetical protein